MTQPHEITPGELVLPRPPGVFRRWLAAQPRTVDWLIVGFYLFGCALMIAADLIMMVNIRALSELDGVAAEDVSSRTEYLTTPWVLLTVVSIVAVAAALRLRRRYPVAGVALVSLLLYFEFGLLVVPNAVALVFLLFAAAVHRGVREAWVSFGIAVVLGVVLVQFSGGTSGMLGPQGIMIAEGPLSDADRYSVNVLNTLWLLAAVMIGINIGNRKRYVEALIDRAHQLAREREQRAGLAAATERSRIAREMHDIVAHSLSVVVTLSEGAAVAMESNPGAAQHAMKRAAETGREALVEMRRLLGVLREPEPAVERAPQPDLAQLASLIEGFREAGLKISLSEAGVPHGDSTHQLTLYRIVQEALTNSLRYAGVGASVQVRLTHEPDRSGIEVTDEPAPNVGPSHRASAAQIRGSGMGLEGARQRALVFGGSLDAGPHGKGWRVQADVPTESQEKERP